MANPVCASRVEATRAVQAEADGPPRKVMRKDKLVILLIFAALVGGGLAIQQCQQGSEGVSSGRSVGPGALDGAAMSAGGRGRIPPRYDVGQIRGFSLQLQSTGEDLSYEKLVTEIAGTGANAVCFIVAAYQENCDSTSIFVEARRTPTAERLKQLVAHARKENLRVLLMPIVLLENPRAGEWRGKINPKSWDDWWEDYDGYILHYAGIAQAAGVDVFMVGSELVSTEKDHGDRWRELVRQVRKRFKGCLSYSANWDHYRPVSWWKDLDIIGMTTYYDLTEGKEATVPRLMESWKPIRKEILEWQATIGRPILFTEVGWPNQTTCAQYPWDYTRSPDKPDPTAQANCFEAFFRTWVRDKPVAGFLVWEWRSHPSQAIGPQDTGYIPCGKPAMKVIEKYYQSPGPAGGPRPLVTRPDMGPTSGPATTAPAATRPAPWSATQVELTPATAEPPKTKTNAKASGPRSTGIPASGETARPSGGR